MAYIGQADQQKAVASVAVPTARAPRMLMSTEGQEGAGKTYFALNRTPRPLTLLDWDFGAEGLNPEILTGVTRYAFDITTTFGATDVEAQRQIAGEVKRFVAEWKKAIREGVRTLVVDTFTAAWAAQRLARKDDKWVEMEEEFRSLVKSALVSQQTNLILIHHLKKDWKKTADGKSYPAGTFSRDGMDGTLTQVQLGIRQRFVPPMIVDRKVVQPGGFEFDILKCRDNVALTGMTMPAMDWQTLCTMVAPSVDWSK